MLCYLRPRDGLPDPKGALYDIPVQAIVQANKEVEEAILKEKGKRGPYKKYTAIDRAKNGKYACNHGSTAAARMFSKKLGKPVTESTARSIKKAYVEELEKQRKAEDGGEIVCLFPKKRGRPFILGKDLDAKVQMYLKKVRESGGAVLARIVMAAAHGIVLFSDKSMLVEFGGHVQFSRHWAHSLLKRMNFVQRKATTAKSKQTVENFRGEEIISR